MARRKRESGAQTLGAASQTLGAASERHWELPRRVYGAPTRWGTGSTRLEVHVGSFLGTPQERGLKTHAAR